MIHDEGFVIGIVQNHCWENEFLHLCNLIRVWEANEIRKIDSKNLLFVLNVMQPRRELIDHVAPLQIMLCFE